jgi:triphosphatase
LSKAERGYRLAHGSSGGHPVTAVAAEMAPNVDAARFLVTTLASCLQQVMGNASEIIAGPLNEELVHQLRIGLRRIRTALRELSSLSPQVEPTWERCFARASRELGAHRDFVTVVPAIRAEMAAAGLKWIGNLGMMPFIRSPQALVSDAEFQRTILAILEFCHSASEHGKPADHARKALRVTLTRLLKTLHAKLVRDAEQFQSLSPEHQHRVRKELKRLRYVSEFVAPLFDVERVKRYLRDWRGAKDALGEYRDYCIGLDALGADLQTGSHNEPALDWLALHIKDRVKHCARTLRKAAKAPVFWEK